MRRAALALWLAAGCAAAGSGTAQAAWSDCAYYAHLARGHLQILQASRPLDEWLHDPAAPEALKERLRRARSIREFASRELQLPDNASYRRYADLGRDAALWNVVAAPRLSLTLRAWCPPVAGCVDYRGYFDHVRALQEAQRLRDQGWDVAVQPVPAYSTLGLMNWAGGDPLLNTFIGYGDGELARLVFHELAHQVVFASGDTAFNESFATAVERIGVRRWLETEAPPAARAQFAASSERRAQWRALTRATREQLAAIYAGPPRPARRATGRLALKAQALQAFRERYAALLQTWGGDPARWRALDEWVAQANNASFGALAAYEDLVPAFETLFERSGGQWRTFYDSVRQLARLPRAERHQKLKDLIRA